MKTTFFLIVLLSMGLHSLAQQSPSQKDIQAFLIRFFDALSARNDEAVKAEVTPDFILLENGKIWNTDSLIKATSLYKGLDIKRVNQLDFVKTEQAGNVAWVSYHNKADILFNGRQIIARWLESAVLVKVKQAWKIELLHSTVINPAL
jgi:hypothetical protein